MSRKSLLDSISGNESEAKFLNLDQITIARECQHRALNPDHVEQMMIALKSGRQFPKGKVVSDGKTYWMFDGFHQLEARRQNKLKSMEVEIFPGDFREAQWRSFRANVENVSLPRTKQELKEIARAIYADPEWKGMSRNAIAIHAGIAEGTLRVWEKRGEITARNVPDEQGSYTITTSHGKSRTYARDPEEISQKKEAFAATSIAQKKVEIPDYAPKFPSPATFQIKPEDIPDRGTFQSVGRHSIYVGDAGDRQFQEDLTSFSLAFVSIPYGWQDWDYEWVWDVANVVAVVIEEPLALYNFCRETQMQFQTALFTNFEGKPAWTGLYARNPLDDLDNAVKGSADLLLRGLTMLHAPRSSDQVLVINRPTLAFHPIISIEETGRKLVMADQNQEAIAREIRNFKIGFVAK